MTLREFQLLLSRNLSLCLSELPMRLEIYLKDSRSVLLVFTDRRKRADMDRRLSSAISGRSATLTAGLTPSGLMSPFASIVGARVLAGFGLDELSTAQRKWQAREISNVCESSTKLLSSHIFLTVHLFEHPQSDIRSHAERCHTIPSIP